MGTMLDARKTIGWSNFRVKDKNGRVLEEPRVAMLMEELEKVNESFLFLFQVWLVFLSLAAGVTEGGGAL